MLCDLQCQMPPFSSKAQTTRLLTSEIPNSSLSSKKYNTAPGNSNSKPLLKIPMCLTSNSFFQEFCSSGTNYGTSMWETPKGKLFKPMNCLVVLLSQRI